MAKTKEESTRLWMKYQKTKDDQSRNQLIEDYLPLVRYTAERLCAKLPHNVDPDDLKSAGIFGLMDAINRYDLERGVKFETFCIMRIRGAMLDELRALDWVPRLVRSRAHKLERAHTELESKLRRTPSDVEVAEKLEMSLKEYDELLREVSAASVLPATRRWTDRVENPMDQVEVVEDRRTPNPELEAQKKELVDFITRNLSRKERLVLLLYYFEELTMKEIGLTLELSESRVCQIHAKVMTRLKLQMGKVRSELV